jgi:hypothetical protein
MVQALTTPSITVNNITVAIVPNSFSYTEGFGEQALRVQSAGGGGVQQVYSDNAETKVSSAKWSMINTAENIALIRTWKANSNANAISATAADGFARTFNNAALTGDYEVNMGADTTIDVEFMSDSAV